MEKKLIWTSLTFSRPYGTEFVGGVLPQTLRAELAFGCGSPGLDDWKGVPVSFSSHVDFQLVVDLEHALRA